jgi:V/A-type H+/Na+-transporting ATPase subunit F
MKIAAIVDKDTAVGLKIAGIKNVFIPKDDNEKSLWFELSEDSEIGVLFITEEIVEKISKEVHDYRLRNNVPVIVEIPDKNGRKKDHEDYISQLIKKAVGLQVEKT